MHVNLLFYFKSFLKYLFQHLYSLLYRADIGVKLGSSGYYDCVSGCGATGLDTKAQMNNLLNNAPASFGGKIFIYLRMFTQNTLFDSNELLSIRVLPSFSNTYKKDFITQDSLKIRKGIFNDW